MRALIQQKGAGAAIFGDARREGDRGRDGDAPLDRADGGGAGLLAAADFKGAGEMAGDADRAAAVLADDQPAQFRVDQRQRGQGGAVPWLGSGSRAVAQMGGADFGQRQRLAADKDPDGAVLAIEAAGILGHQGAGDGDGQGGFAHRLADGRAGLRAVEKLGVAAQRVKAEDAPAAGRRVHLMVADRPGPQPPDLQADIAKVPAPARRAVDAPDLDPARGALEGHADAGKSRLVAEIHRRAHGRMRQPHGLGMDQPARVFHRHHRQVRCFRGGMFQRPQRALARPERQRVGHAGAQVQPVGDVLQPAHPQEVAQIGHDPWRAGFDKGVVVKIVQRLIRDLRLTRDQRCERPQGAEILGHARVGRGDAAPDRRALGCIGQPHMGGQKSKDILKCQVHAATSRCRRAGSSVSSSAATGSAPCGSGRPTAARRRGCSMGVVPR